MTRPRASQRLALALVSFAALLFQILLTRVFAVTLWYHFANLSISLAMTGTFLGALLCYRFKGNFLQNSARVQAVSALTGGVAAVMAVVVHLQIDFEYVTVGSPETYVLLLVQVLFLTL